MAARVGLTGGIGSGKSAVAERFAGLGVRVVDADRIARELTAPGTAQFDAIVETFGDRVVDADGDLDRARLREAVFTDAGRRKQLEDILHPPIRAAMFARADADAGAYCILDIPLLVESGQHREMTRVVAVTCSLDARMQRLQQRGLARAEIKRIIATQASDEQRLAIADDVIDNDGGVDELAPQVKTLHENFVRLFS